MQYTCVEPSWRGESLAEWSEMVICQQWQALDRYPSAGSFSGSCTYGYECATVCACLSYVCQIQRPYAMVTVYLIVMMLVDMIVG